MSRPPFTPANRIGHTHSSQGVALGSRVADADLPHWQEAVLSAIFVVAAPVGLAIGVGVYTSLNVSGEAFLLAQGKALSTACAAVSSSTSGALAHPGCDGAAVTPVHEGPCVAVEQTRLTHMQRQSVPVASRLS